ncbi:hypothetical protein DFH06DRAFT_359163 [Mycena polygramma]|nr:hypothetical protein DFH06DRAFT_359163 [Mycena polygramma]
MDLGCRCLQMLLAGLSRSCYGAPNDTNISEFVQWKLDRRATATDSAQHIHLCVWIHSLDEGRDRAGIIIVIKMNAQLREWRWEPSWLFARSRNFEQCVLEIRFPAATWARYIV